MKIEMENQDVTLGIPTDASLKASNTRWIVKAVDGTMALTAHPKVSSHELVWHKVRQTRIDSNGCEVMHIVRVSPSCYRVLHHLMIVLNEEAKTNLS